MTLDSNPPLFNGRVARILSMIQNCVLPQPAGPVIYKKTLFYLIFQVSSFLPSIHAPFPSTFLSFFPCRQSLIFFFYTNINLAKEKHETLSAGNFFLSSLPLSHFLFFSFFLSLSSFLSLFMITSSCSLIIHLLSSFLHLFVLLSFHQISRNIQKGKKYHRLTINI